MSVVAVLGAGKVGVALARSLVAGGHEVRIAGSVLTPELELTAAALAPGATPAEARDAVEGSDVVVVAIPLRKLHSLDPAMLAGRVVVDAMNHWEPTEGRLAEFADSELSTSEVVAEHLSGSRVVKSFNHLGYHELDDASRPTADGSRRALVAASDDAEAAAVVARLVESLGFDALVVTPLAAGRALEPGSEIFSRPHSAESAARHLPAGAAVLEAPTRR